MTNSTNNLTSIEKNIILWKSILNEEVLKYAEQFINDETLQPNGVINACNMLSHYQEKQEKLKQMIMEWMEEIKKVESK